MSESEAREFLAAAWHSAQTRMASMIEEYSSMWAPNGPSKMTAEAIVKKIYAMPVPTPPESTPKQERPQ